LAAEESEHKYQNGGVVWSHLKLISGSCLPQITFVKDAEAHANAQTMCRAFMGSIGGQIIQYGSMVFLVAFSVYVIVMNAPPPAKVGRLSKARFRFVKGE
jgi:hypothetical protein